VAGLDSVVRERIEQLKVRRQGPDGSPRQGSMTPRQMEEALTREFGREVVEREIGALLAQMADAFAAQRIPSRREMALAGAALEMAALPDSIDLAPPLVTRMLQTFPTPLAYHWLGRIADRFLERHEVLGALGAIVENPPTPASLKDALLGLALYQGHGKPDSNPGRGAAAVERLWRHLDALDSTDDEIVRMTGPARRALAAYRG
jgi:hypothetical protein